MRVRVTSANLTVPMVRFYFTTAPHDHVVAECVAIPGVKALRAKMGGRRPVGTVEAVQSPLNTAWRVEQFLIHYQTPFNVWRPKVPVVQSRLTRPLTEVGARATDLETGKGLAEFLLSYQQREIPRWIDQPAVLNQWPMGCLAGDTEIAINRGGGARRMKLRDFVAKFNGAVSCGKKWRSDVTTMSQSVVGGVVRLNRVTAAVCSGVKETFTVTTGKGGQIRATGDHKFMLVDGSFKALRDLAEGDCIVTTDNERAVQASEKVAPESVNLKATVDQIVSIERFGLEETYDLSMADPHNNFVANGFVVHNSGKTLSALLYALADTGPVVVLTGAKGRGSWAYQVKRFTTCESYTIYGEDYKEVVNIPVGIIPPHMSQAGIREERARIVAAYPTVQCGCGIAHELEKVVSKRTEEGLMCFFMRMKLAPGQHTMFGGAVGLEVTAPQIPESARFIICSWEGLVHHVAELIKLRPATLIMDEVHRAKSHKRYEKVLVSEEELATTSNAKQLEDGSWAKFVPRENIAESAHRLRAHADRVMLLSGTPLKDRVRDLWAICDYLAPGAFGNYRAFTTRYCAGHANVWGGWDDKGGSNLDELFTRMAFYVSHVSDAEAKANLPPMRREPVYLGADLLTAEDPEAAEELRLAEADVAARGGDVRSVAEKRLYAACSRKRKPIVDDFYECVTNGQKVVLLVGRRRDVTIMRQMVDRKLGKHEPQVQVWSGDGSTPAGCRGAAARDEKEMCRKCRDCIRIEYMAKPSHAGLIGTGYAFGEQVDLQDTDLLIIGQLPYTITDLLQWIGRCHRQGGTRKLLVKLMIAEGTYDERVASMLLEKLPAVVKMGIEGAAGIRESLVGDQDALLKDLANEIMSREEPA